MTDWRSAPIDPKLRTTLAFLEKLAVPNGKVGPDEIAAMRAAGVSDPAIEDAIYVCFSFNIISRLADAFEFELVTPDQMKEGARNMLRFGYGMTSM